jgi:hypothetical protein
MARLRQRHRSLPGWRRDERRLRLPPAAVRESPDAARGMGAHREPAALRVRRSLPPGEREDRARGDRALLRARCPALLRLRQRHDRSGAGRPLQGASPAGGPRPVAHLRAGTRARADAGARAAARGDGTGLTPGRRGEAVRRRRLRPGGRFGPAEARHATWPQHRLSGHPGAARERRLSHRRPAPRPT